MDLYRSFSRGSVGVCGLGLLIVGLSCAVRGPAGPGEKAAGPVRISPENANAADAAIGRAENGDLLAVYVEHQDKSSADLYLQRLDADGRPLAERVRINEVQGTATAWFGDPPTITVGTTDAIFVGWTRRPADSKARGTDLVLSVSQDGGRSFAPAVKVNDDTKPASHGMHSLAVDSRGRVIMAWLDERNVVHHPPGTGDMSHEAAEPNSEVFFAVSDDMGKTFAPNKQLAKDVCPCCKTAVVTDGRLAFISWRQVLAGDLRHVAVAASTDGGSTFGDAVIVSDDKWQINACPVSGAPLLLSDQELYVAWYSGGEAGPTGIYVSHSRDGGKSFVPRRLIDLRARTGTPALLRTDASLLTVFDGMNQDLQAATLDVSASVIGNKSIANASMPSATSIPGGVAVLFIRPNETRPSVWFHKLGR